jgi:hypothetical protein
MDKVVDKEIEKEANAYINQLSIQEKLVLDIAKTHLGSSFDIEKSIGFLQWRETKE